MKPHSLALLIFAAFLSTNAIAAPLTWSDIDSMTRPEARAAKDRLTAELKATGFDGREHGDFQAQLDAANATTAYRCVEKENDPNTVALLIVSADQKKVTYRANPASLAYTAKASQADGKLSASFKMDLNCGYAPAGGDDLNVVCQRLREKVTLSPETLTATVRVSYVNVLDWLAYSPFEYSLNCQAIAVSDLRQALEYSRILRDQIGMIQARLDRSLNY